MSRFFTNNCSHLLAGITFYIFLQSATADVHAEINVRRSFDNATVSNHTSAQAKISSEILCYNLPYGGLGFLSHVLTYYTAVCIGIGVRPLSPWKQTSRSRRRCNLFIATLQLIASNVIAIITMFKCRNEWQFILISLWHAFLSTTLGSMVIHRGTLQRDEDDDSKAPFKWLAFYVIGVIIGLVGVFSLVTETWEIQAVKDITYAFGSVGAFFALLAGILWLLVVLEDGDGYCETLWGTIGMTLFGAASLTGLFAAWYSDWLLGVMSGNLEGGPGRGANKVLWWIYFMSKRLPMLVQ